MLLRACECRSPYVNRRAYTPGERLDLCELAAKGTRCRYSKTGSCPLTQYLQGQQRVAKDPRVLHTHAVGRSTTDEVDARVGGHSQNVCEQLVQIRQVGAQPRRALGVDHTCRPRRNQRQLVRCPEVAPRAGAVHPGSATTPREAAGVCWHSHHSIPAPPVSSSSPPSSARRHPSPPSLSRARLWAGSVHARSAAVASCSAVNQGGGASVR